METELCKHCRQLRSQWLSELLQLIAVMLLQNHLNSEHSRSSKILLHLGGLIAAPVLVSPAISNVVAAANSDSTFVFVSQSCR